MKPKPAKTKKQPKKTQKKPLFWQPWAWGVALLLVLILTLLGVSSYRHHTRQVAINNQKVQFQQAESNLTKLNTALSSQYKYQWLTQNLSKYCGYTSNFNEIYRGDLYCEITDRFLYPSTSKSLAIQSAQQIFSVISSKNLAISSPQVVDNMPSLSDRSLLPQQVLASTYKDRGGLECNITMNYVPDINNLNYAKDIHSNFSSNTGLEVLVSCGVRPALSTYYPVSN